MFSRRSFLKLGGGALASVALASRLQPFPQTIGGHTWDFQPSQLLGRMAWPWEVPIYSRPSPEGTEGRKVGLDEVIPLVREVVGRGLFPHNHVWYEVENGYVYSSYFQPVRNIVGTPLKTVAEDGLWAEVSVPFVDAFPRPDATLKRSYRLYYSALYKIAGVELGGDGQAWYRLLPETEIALYVPATTMRIIAPEEVTPLSPNVDNKRIDINLADQVLTAYEGNAEVFRTRIASGRLFYGDDPSKPQSRTGIGTRYIWQKRYSRHMQSNAYDVPGVGWVSYYSSNGEALHSAYWHNDFGRPKSAGCINCRPDDAKWLFRWTLPHVEYHPGDLTVQWDNRGTMVEIRAE
jgi:lipoprotein-anchoring transpeptidase ErfK/SrfK